MTRSTYDKFPTIDVPDGAGAAVAGWAAVGDRLRAAGARRVIVETYPGVDDDELLPALTRALSPARTIDARDALLCPDRLAALVEPDLTDDPVFGRLSTLGVGDLFDAARAARLAADANGEGLTLVYGTGAALIAGAPRPGDVLVYADLARWEIQRRQRAGRAGNLGVPLSRGTASQRYKRAFFLDWRAADRLKRDVWDRVDFVLDTNTPNEPRLVDGPALRAALRHVAARPFRVVPFFDPGPWGGQWMKEVCDLDRSAANFAWCFDCVPEENSLLLRFGDVRVEVPSIDLVFQEPLALLGPGVYGRFGAEFPIRFDFLDTVEGGNLSLQVHPLTQYIRDHFGMAYTQDESYYLLDARPGEASVYLGFREGVDRAAFLDQLGAAQAGGPAPDVDRFVNRFEAKKHDHFLIPAGTIHCSARGAMVLEISATPYIFTFKLWDWDRLGLDGRPRPIHLAHGARNLDFGRTTAWVERELVNAVTEVARGDGWREERTGLHALESIETRRHWFTGPVDHDTRGTVNVLNLVEGAEATVESPTGAFAPFVVHYAETFVVPAAAGAYRIRPSGPAAGRECATLKAFVRCHA